MRFQFGEGDLEGAELDVTSDVFMELCRVRRASTAIRREVSQMRRDMLAKMDEMIAKMQEGMDKADEGQSKADEVVSELVRHRDEIKLDREARERTGGRT